MRFFALPLFQQTVGIDGSYQSVAKERNGILESYVNIIYTYGFPVVRRLHIIGVLWYFHIRIYEAVSLSVWEYVPPVVGIFLPCNLHFCRVEIRLERRHTLKLGTEEGE